MPIFTSKSSAMPLAGGVDDYDSDFQGRKRVIRVNSLGRRRQSGIGVSNLESPDDDAVFYVNDDKYSVLEVGRDYEPIYITHKYTEEEKKTLATFQSHNYLPSHSSVYKDWIRRQRPQRLDMDKWIMMGLVGFFVGLVGFLQHNLIEQIADFKWRFIEAHIKEGNFVISWVFATFYSVAIAVFSAALVVFWRPSAIGSGIPEVTGFLNGVYVRHIFSVKTMVAKFFSLVAAIGCGLPVGPEGPMIHLGALVGAGVSQTRSQTLRLNFPFFKRFRNTEDRRNFISAGAAAGVAAAFGAPVGGLLFSMEEMSSFWSTTLCWQIFFCCIVATITTDLFNSAFRGFIYTGDFGQFKTTRYILFQIDAGVDINLVMFLPTLLIGAMGGILGALFTILNLKVARLRKRLLSRTSRKWLQNVIRLLEPAVIVVLVTSVSVFLPAAFACTEFTCQQGENMTYGCVNDTRSSIHSEEAMMVKYRCTQGTVWRRNETYHTNSSYNEIATLMFGGIEGAVERLFSRGTHLQFSYASLVTALPYYFLMVCWASSSSVASGMLVPMLMIGSLYGRLIGRLMVSIGGIHSRAKGYWSWIDPGAFALIGAASFFGGVTRLALAVTVIMMELTNDVQALLPVMVAVMTAKWIGDFFTHPVFHAQLELKCIPYLDPEPKITSSEGRRIHLELYQASDVMASPVVTLNINERVSTIAHLLLTTSHNGFPVVKSTEGHQICHGLISRLELSVLLQKDQLFLQEGDAIGNEEELTWVDYHELSIDRLTNPDEHEDTLRHLQNDPQYLDLFINLAPYVNQSAFTVHAGFSLQRTYILFRTLGLRHLTVVDSLNRIVGIITRKDIMGFHIEEQLTAVMMGNRRENPQNRADGGKGNSTQS